MDEVLFRSSQKLESLQHQIGVAANEGKYFLREHSVQVKNEIANLLHRSKLDEVQEVVKKFISNLISFGKGVKNHVVLYLNPYDIYHNCVCYFSRRWTRGELIIGCTGLLVGGLVGFCIGLMYHKNNHPVHYMQAAQCLSYDGIEAVHIVEDAIAPEECGDDEVIITVKAASVQVIDAKICNGYGRRIRKFMSKYFKHIRNDLPVTLGRDCTGIVVDIGRLVTDLEIGDEVWLSSPFWAPGTISQTVISPSCLVGKKPKNIGYESGCSLPHSWGIVLDMLKQAKLTEDNSNQKNVFIHGACTPVGCILTQILLQNNCVVTGSCYKRAEPVLTALGVHNVITIEKDVDNLLKQLELHEKFDFVFLTQEISIEKTKLEQLCNDSNNVFIGYYKSLFSDDCSFVSYGFFSLYLFVKYYIFGACPNFGPFSLVCKSKLDQLSKLAENGKIQTVVDNVVEVQHIERLLNHVQSQSAIGSSVVTFR